ncbi:hypothetical protein F3Y22_tig00111721pilonHSYRG00063 [Hibiscus syriacus]|uniref:DUF641 domain-containing protein n=1 Tax=Hibiscus syriacus TaxID=106335 RepID=A0A6A2XX88_HIBSY|nr:hypothetical protein F3Y22_tig00111721pilonHSYRG00063 [Hibiscus syriacus]
MVSVLNEPKRATRYSTRKARLKPKDCCLGSSGGHGFHRCHFHQSCLRRATTGSTPLNNDAIQAADEAVVEQLKVLSELKHKFLKQELDVSPQVTLMLAEIQEQQSLMRTYEIRIKKLESDIVRKIADISLHHKQLKDCTFLNKSMEKKLNQSGLLSMFDNIKITMLNPSDFVQVLHFTMKFVRSFVRLMMKEMEIAKWDVDAVAKSIDPGTILAKQSHRCFVFESFRQREDLEATRRFKSMGSRFKSRGTCITGHWLFDRDLNNGHAFFVFKFEDEDEGSEVLASSALKSQQYPTSSRYYKMTEQASYKTRGLVQFKTYHSRPVWLRFEL